MQNKLVAQAKATICNATKFGVVILEPSSNDILIGMDFLHTFKLALFLTKLRIALFDENVFDQIAKEAKAKKKVEEAQAEKPAQPEGDNPK